MAASGRFYKWKTEQQQEAWNMAIEELHNKVNEVMTELEKQGLADRILEAVEEAKNRKATVTAFVRKK
jgi:DNA-binding transcriptional regulator GbsR (MarR family)